MLRADRRVARSSAHFDVMVERVRRRSLSNLPVTTSWRQACRPPRVPRGQRGYVRLPDGTVLYRQRRADFFNCSGDSGGIVYRPLERRKAMAVGIYAGGRNRGECPWFEAFYSHLRWAENDMQLKVCIRGRARCGR
jgi:hypothetical protein